MKDDSKQKSGITVTNNAGWQWGQFLVTVWTMLDGNGNSGWWVWG